MGHSRRDIVFLRDGYRCQYCGIILAVTTPGQRRYRALKGGKPAHNEATVDHLILKCDGGTRDLSNLIAACYACNHKRGADSVKNFLQGDWLTKRIKNWGDPAHAMQALVAVTRNPPKPLDNYSQSVLDIQP